MAMRAPDDDYQWISTFLDAQAAELGAARNTLLAYGRDLKDVAQWINQKSLSFLKAQQPDIEAYLISCDAEGLSRATRARRLSAIKQIYRFAFEEGWRDDNPALQIKGPGRAKSLPKTLDVAEVDRLLDAARVTGRTEADRLRNTCLMELLYATGMRVTELVSLPVSAARGDPNMLLILGKGGKERMVPLSPPARKALSVWLTTRDAAEDAREAKGHKPSKFLFPSRSQDGHLTRHRFYLLIKELAVTGACRQTRSHHIPCAMPLPRIFWQMVPICGRFRRSWAMRISQRPRFTPTFWTPDWRNWCTSITRSRNRTRTQRPDARIRRLNQSHSPP